MPEPTRPSTCRNGSPAIPPTCSPPISVSRRSCLPNSRIATCSSLRRRNRPKAVLRRLKWGGAIHVGIAPYASAHHLLPSCERASYNRTRSNRRREHAALHGSGGDRDRIRRGRPLGQLREK